MERSKRKNDISTQVCFFLSHFREIPPAPPPGGLMGGGAKGSVDVILSDPPFKGFLHMSEHI